MDAYETTDNAFKITLYNRQYLCEQSKHKAKKLTKREQETLNLFTKDKTIKRHDIENQLGISQAMSVKLLRKLLEAGYIKKGGTGNNVHYSL